MKIQFKVSELQRADRQTDTAACGKLPPLTACKCDLDTTHDWHYQSVTGDGKTGTCNWQCSGRRGRVCDGEQQTGGTNIRKLFANCRGRLMSTHYIFLVIGAAGRKQADSMCLSVFRGGTVFHNTAHQNTTASRNVGTQSERRLPHPSGCEKLRTRNINLNGDKTPSPYRAVNTLRLLYKPVS